MKPKIYFTIVLFLLVTGCKSDQGDHDNKSHLVNLDFHEELSVSIDELNALIGGAIEGIAVDTAGNIYFQDREQASIHILDPAGRYLD